MMRPTQPRAARSGRLRANRAEQRELPPLPVAVDVDESHAPQPVELLGDRRQEVRRVVVGGIDAERGEELVVQPRRRRRDVLEVEERAAGRQAVVYLAVE